MPTRPIPALPITARRVNFGETSSILVTVTDSDKLQLAAGSCAKMGRIELQLDSSHSFWLHPLETYTDPQIDEIVDYIKALPA